MKFFHGSWPTWPPPTEVIVAAVFDLAMTIVARGCGFTERQVELLHCSVRSAVEVGFARWESFASLDGVNVFCLRSAQSCCRQTLCIEKCIQAGHGTITIEETLKWLRLRLAGYLPDKRYNRMDMNKT